MATFYVHILFPTFFKKVMQTQNEQRDIQDWTELSFLIFE